MKKLIADESSSGQEEFEKELNVQLPLGDDEAKVICVLKELGWEYIFDKGHNAYSASKKLKGGFFSKKQVNMNVFLDNEKKVIKVEVYVSSTSIFG